jgi:Ulp1 family protease
MAALITTLLDADIYESDLDLFRGKSWLNDSCINYCLRQLELRISNRNILLMNPSVVSFLMIQCDEEDDYRELATGIEINTREWIFVPVNNSDSFFTVSTHWSLLLVQTKTGKSYHFDSCGMHNNTAAQLTAEKIFVLLGK